MQPISPAICIVLVLVTTAVHAVAKDNGDGTYTNPPLLADYPDPDIIRVGDDFYLVSSTFANSPGLAVLRSQDLVNWATVGNVIDRLRGDPRYDMSGGTLYRNGIFAPSIRQRDGTFYVAVQPNGTGQGLQIYKTTDPAGKWQLSQLDQPAFDPALFFDDDGTPYVIWSGAWHPEIYLRQLSPNLDRFVGEPREIHNYPGLEGTHVVKRGDYYYMFHSRPGQLAMYVSRSKNLFGDWETKRIIDDRSGSGHQGAIVDLPNGDWYGFAMLDQGPIGRVTNISPISWQDDWPVWGDNNVIPKQAKKPIAGQEVIEQPASIDFDGPALSPDWRWNHNPDDARWSLTERPGFLRLSPTVASEFWLARNSLTHKGWGPKSCLVARLDIARMQPGDCAGLGMLGKSLATLTVERSADGQAKLVLSTGIQSGRPVAPTASTNIGDVDTVQLALAMDYNDNMGRCGYSLDGKSWTAIGDEFPLMWDWRTGTFQGQQYAVFCFNPEPSEGFVDVDSLRFVEPIDFATGWIELIGAHGPVGIAKVGRNLSGCGDVEAQPNSRTLTAIPGFGVVAALTKFNYGDDNNLLSSQEFGDAEVDLEFLLGKGSNSGVKLQQRYEIQLFDSHGKKKLSGTDCGGIYPHWKFRASGQGLDYVDEGIAPQVNAARPASEWQTLHIVFRAPRFDDQGRKTANARFVSVTLNDQQIHRDVEIDSPTGNISSPLPEVAKAALFLQLDHGPVAFRNVRVKPLRD